MCNTFKYISLCFIICCAGNNGKLGKSTFGRSPIDFEVYPFKQAGKEGVQLYLNLPNSIFVFKKITGQFQADVRISAAIFNSDQRRIAHQTWNLTPTEKYFDDTRDQQKYFTTDYFFPLEKGKYSISLLVEDLDSGYQWRKEKKEIQVTQSARSVIPFIKTGEDFVFTGSIIPEKTDTFYLQIYTGGIKTDSNYAVYNLEIEGNQVFTDSILIGTSEQMVVIPIAILESWAGILTVKTRVHSETDKLELQLPGHNVFYWKDIKTTIQIMSYILTYKEYKQVTELEEPEQLEFIKHYWKQLDPTPKTVYNEVKEEFFRRIKRVNAEYSEFGSGWQSDRGRIYIIYGEPDQVEKTQRNAEGYSFEIWYYPHGKQFIFIDEGLFGNYRLYREVN